MSTITKNPSSEDPPSSADTRSAPQARLITLEGMPGAGKTTLADVLSDQGYRVLGEYTVQDPKSVPYFSLAAMPPVLRLSEHPAVDDDQAHQANWLRKAAQAKAALGTGGPVFVDRDWLSALAYAYSIAEADQGHLLRQRAIWAQTNVAARKLLVADAYVVFDLDVALSLSRRARRLRSEHPWSHPRVLRRLRSFYRRPIPTLQRLSPDLAARLSQVRWSYLSGTTCTSHALTLIHALAQTEADGRTL